MLEDSKTPRSPDQDRKYDPLTPRMDQGTFVSVTAEYKEINEAQNIEKGSVSVPSDETREIKLNDGKISPNEDAKIQEPALQNVKIHLDSTYLEVASRNGLADLDHMGIPPSTVFVQHGVGKLIPVDVEITNDSVPMENDDRGFYGQRRKRKAKSKDPASSSCVLHSESPMAPEPFENVKEGYFNGEKKRRGRKSTKLQNEFSRTRTHLRYLLHRIRYEQNLIDAYSAEGWRGQSLEKLKPEKELEKAKSHILRYKLKIRALFQHLDQSLAVGKLPESLFDAQGEIGCEDIFCAKCGSKDLTLDNDIILCDGACQRGFHQFCLEPPLLKDDIPPGNESWLCPGCECKGDCIHMLKEFQGAKISIIDSWEKIFPEAASGKKMDAGSGSSSDDSEDEEYDPDKPDSSEKVEEEKSSSDESTYFSGPNNFAASHNNDPHVGLPSDDSEDDDFDPSAADRDSPDQDNQAKQDNSSCSDFTSDSEDLGGLIEDQTAAHHKQEALAFNEEISNTGRRKRQSPTDELSYLTEASAEPISGKRRVERLDYQKLNDETFGNSSSDSSDEDFDDTITRKKKNSVQGSTEVKSSNITIVTDSNTHKEDQNQIEADGHTNDTSLKVGSDGASARKSTHKRLPEAARQRLYASFSENQYPHKTVKANLAVELGLTIRQVSIWFENARRNSNHRSGLGSASSQPTTRADDRTVSAQNHILKPS